MHIDNKSSIKLEKNPILHGRVKHNEANFCLLREQVDQGKLVVAHCPTSAQVWDVLTKILKTDRLLILRKTLGAFPIK